MQPQNPNYPPQQQQVMQPQQPQYYQAQQPMVQQYPQQYAQPVARQPMNPQTISFLSMLLIAIGALLAGVGWIITTSWDHIIIGLGYILAAVGVFLMAMQKNKMI
jgi:hypothetical protein